MAFIISAATLKFTPCQGSMTPEPLFVKQRGRGEARWGWGPPPPPLPGLTRPGSLPLPWALDNGLPHTPSLPSIPPQFEVPPVPYSLLFGPHHQHITVLAHIHQVFLNIICDSRNHIHGPEPADQEQNRLRFTTFGAETRTRAVPAKVLWEECRSENKKSPPLPCTDTSHVH